MGYTAQDTKTVCVMNCRVKPRMKREVLDFCCSQYVPIKFLICSSTCSQQLLTLSQILHPKFYYCNQHNQSRRRRLHITVRQQIIADLEHSVKPSILISPWTNAHLDPPTAESLAKLKIALAEFSACKKLQQKDVCGSCYFIERCRCQLRCSFIQGK